MARQLRKKNGTGIYHVMVRGINRQDIFEDEEGLEKSRRNEELRTMLS